MTASIEKNRESAKGGGAMRGNPRDMQLDETTGLPVAITPDGEKADSETGVDPEERLRIDPESRIPKPVQPDLA